MLVIWGWSWKVKGTIAGFCLLQLPSENAEIEILPHSRLEAPAWWKTCTQLANWEAGLHWYFLSNLPLGISERRLTQNQTPPRFLSVSSTLTPKGPRASTGFFSVLLWTAGIVSKPSSSWSSSTFQPLKEPLKQAMPWNYASIIFVLWPADPWRLVCSFLGRRMEQVCLNSIITALKQLQWDVAVPPQWASQVGTPALWPGFGGAEPLFLKFKSLQWLASSSSLNVLKSSVFKPRKQLQGSTPTPPWKHHCLYRGNVNTSSVLGLEMPHVRVDCGSLSGNIPQAPSLAWYLQGKRVCWWAGVLSARCVTDLHLRLLDISLDTLETLWLISKQFVLIT